jgi:hypothetical protein
MTAVVLNVTHAGLSYDLSSPVHIDTPDEDIRRIAAEDRGVPPETFDLFVVDRLENREGVPKFYLRPKVPFGSEDAIEEDLKGSLLDALGAVTKYQGFLIDLMGNDSPPSLPGGLSELTARFLEVNDTYQEVQLGAMALALHAAAQKDRLDA